MIKEVVDKIREVDGVVGIVLFGSYVRGDYDEGSDIDLIVVFRDRSAFTRSLREVYKVTSESNLFFQVVCLTFDELKDSPLLELVLREGKVYYASENVERLLTSRHKPYTLITYSTANLKPRERVSFTQKLEGRGKGKYRYDGLLRPLGGYKVGRGVMMVPLEKLNVITQYLEKKGVDYVIRHVWV